MEKQQSSGKGNLVVALRDLHFLISYHHYPSSAQLDKKSEAILEEIFPQFANYAFEDIFNGDETENCWNTKHVRSLTNIESFGRKKEKVSIKILLTRNAIGFSRLPLWFISISEHRNSFPVENLEDLELLGAK
ncbi:hypothetical protein GcM3_043035 [Golovinomyces cichoracearum]|uniref:Uncharacterized protein n=1 Tax=Golovinomyces cichoracearum TaxID=62708 RepID=A0A420J1F1_9PEZI|nr:hypothetical protein GcM3_043035 [Golovinomyces cichoracearum]